MHTACSMHPNAKHCILYADLDIVRILLPFSCLLVAPTKEIAHRRGASDPPEYTDDLAAMIQPPRTRTQRGRKSDNALGTLSGQVIYDVPWLEDSPVAANAQLIAPQTATMFALRPMNMTIDCVTQAHTW